MKKSEKTKALVLCNGSCSNPKPFLTPKIEENSDEKIDEKCYEYNVGDIVWLQKFTSRWWPGRIYNPSDVIENVAEKRLNNELLVISYGDNAARCIEPSELQPFAERFQDLSKHSNDRFFKKSVRKALKDASFHLRSKMCCKCFPPDKIKNFSTDVRPGVSVPESNSIKKLTEGFVKPVDFLARLKEIAVTGCGKSVFEAPLLATYITKFDQITGRPPAVYDNQYILIEGLEHTEELYIKREKLELEAEEAKRKKVKKVKKVLDEKIETEAEKLCGTSSRGRSVKRSRFRCYPYITLPENQMKKNKKKKVQIEFAVDD